MDENGYESLLWMRSVMSCCYEQEQLRAAAVDENSYELMLRRRPGGGRAMCALESALLRATLYFHRGGGEGSLRVGRRTGER
jgi:hypothetical protein